MAEGCLLDTTDRKGERNETSARRQDDDFNESCLHEDELAFLDNGPQ